MRVAHRNALDYGIYGVLELLANFWQNGFVRENPEKGKSENGRVFTGDEWWAWVDLNHRPRPYQECDLRNMFATICRFLVRSTKIIDCRAKAQRS
jgi:hypothetical protein